MRWVFLLLLVITIDELVAQTPQAANSIPPITSWEVSGIVLDSTRSSVPGATLTLKYNTDSLSTSTNVDGIFVFKGVKSATFYLTVRSLGYKPITYHLLNDDRASKIILDPVMLVPDSRMLAQVTIDGTPNITYKTDTIEYRASGYQVREFATVDELLKKMEGMQVSRDGTLTHQGELITKARLNGRDFLGGSVASTIQNLPAEIIEKVQIVNDYGDQAARTGIKEGDPKKILNLTTKADRSIGNMASINTGAGDDERYQGQLFGTRINANETIGLNANLSNTVNGIANPEFNSSKPISNNSMNLATSGGTSQTLNPTFSYSNALNEKIYINLSYSYNNSRINSINKNNVQQFSTSGTTFSQNEENQNTNNKIHNFTSLFEYEINKANFLSISPKLSYHTSSSDNNLSSMQSGLIHQNQYGLNKSNSTIPDIGGVLFYQHIFNKLGRNFTVQLSSDISNQNNDTERNTRITYFENDSDLILKDSLIQRQINNKNQINNYRASTTYSEPLSTKSRLQFNGQINYRSYDNSKITSDILSGNISNPIDSLSNNYNYSFTETRLALNYLFTEKKYNFSLGVNAIPTVLEGNGANHSTHKTNFNLIPIAKFQYTWSNQHLFQINYSGSPIEPNFNQLQPVRDVSNPQNSIIGNPDLKPSFAHTINANYNRYIANSQFAYSVNLNTKFINDQVVRNLLLIEDAYNSLKYETHFLNLDGDYTFNANYSLSKQFSSRKYYFALDGLISNMHSNSMSNNLKNTTSIWRYIERFGPRMQPTDWLEINPYLSYDVIKSTNSIPSSLDINTQTFAFNIDGTISFPKGFRFGYYASKNYRSGISNNITKNPFVLNTYLERRFSNRIGATLRIEAFDIFNQNNFINRIITENSIIDTQTNPLSRYFMITFGMNLQKWSGTPQQNGHDLPRRGDGSFIRQ